MQTLESHSSLLFLASEKSKIKDGYIWDDHLEKFLVGSFALKSLLLTFRKDMKSLLEMLLPRGLSACYISRIFFL